MYLFIVGAGGHGKAVAEIAQLAQRYEQIFFLDDMAPVGSVGPLGLPVAGPIGSVRSGKGKEYVVAIGSSVLREEIMGSLMREGCAMATLVHPSAVVSEDARLGVGTVVMAGAVVNPRAQVGKGCIINTAASIDHDTVVGDYAHISVGAHLAGGVAVGERSWIGIGAVVSNGVQIGSDCLVGAGGVVVKNLDVPGTYVGVPARIIDKTGTSEDVL